MTAHCKCNPHTYTQPHAAIFIWFQSYLTHEPACVCTSHTTVKNSTKPVFTCSLSVIATALAFLSDNSYRFNVLSMICACVCVHTMRPYWWMDECMRLNRQWRHSYICRNTVGSHTWFCYLCHFLKSPNELNTNRIVPSLFFAFVALSLSLSLCVYYSECFAFAYTLLNFIDAIVETVLKISFTVSSALDKLLYENCGEVQCQCKIVENSKCHFNEYASRQQQNRWRWCVRK